MELRPSEIVGTLTIGVGVLGALAAVLGAGAGQPVSLQRLAFSAGAVTLVLLLGVVAFAITGVLASGLVGVVRARAGHTRTGDDARAQRVVVAAAVLGGLALTAALTVSGLMADFDETDPSGQVFLALLGMAALAAGVTTWWRLRRRERR